MPTPTYIPLATFTVTSSVASVSFSSISQIYRDLVCVVTATNDSTAGVMQMRLNNDGANNYTWLGMTGNGSSGSSGNGTINYIRGNNLAYIDTSVGHNSMFHLMDYSATDKHKTVLVRANNGNRATEAFANRWASTSAVNTIRFNLSTGYIVAGSTFNLFGIAA
jgi:hypothetical protein